jgi:DNA-binding transcriptional LysR family regulator
VIHFSLRQIEYFDAAARFGGAAAAAKALQVSQPSISKAIAELESMWGEQLFVRLHARGLELTAAGAVRFKQAHALLRQAQALTAPRAQALSGSVRLGCLSTLGARYLPGILARMQADYPGIRVHVEEGDTETLTRQIERGALDTALMYDLGLARNVRLQPVAELWPYALLAHGHALAGKTSLRLADLASEPLVLINLPHSRAYFLSLFHAAGLSPQIAYESASMGMVRTLVANGLGVSLLTTRPVRDVSYDGKKLACRALGGSLRPQIVVLAFPLGGDPQPDLSQALQDTVQVIFERQKSGAGVSQPAT